MTKSQFRIQYNKIVRDFLKIVKVEILKNFDMEVEADGKTKWKPLEPTTEVDRFYRGYDPSSPILNRKSILRNSIKVKLEGKKITAYSDLDYAQAHQKGARNPKQGAKPIPPRPFLDYPASCSKGGKMYEAYFDKPVRTLLKKMYPDMDF